MRDEHIFGNLGDKTVEELREILANEDMLPLDDESNTELIFRITELIIQKENKSTQQREEELGEFWTKLTESHGDKIPVNIKDTVRNREIISEPLGNSVNRHSKPRRFPKRQLVIAAAIVFILIISNIIAVQAFDFNIFRVIVGFTDDLFKRAIVTPDMEDDPINVSDEDTGGEFASFQDALDEFGIEHIHAPTWLPEGYQYARAEAGSLPNCDFLLAIYTDGGRELSIGITIYDDVLDVDSFYYEKSMGTPIVYTYSEHEIYIFVNVDMTIATWVDGLYNCDIQGNISEEEIKSIIKSLYSED